MVIEARNEHGTFEYIVETEADLATIIGPQRSEFALAVTEGTIWYHDGSAWQQISASGGAGLIVSRGGTLFASGGLTTGGNIIVWRAPYSCTVTNVRGFRSGGSGATVNARRNGSATFLASNLSLTSADDWLDGGAVQNTALVAGDEVEMQVVTVTGSPTQVAVQIDMVRT